MRKGVLRVGQGLCPCCHPVAVLPPVLPAETVTSPRLHRDFRLFFFQRSVVFQAVDNPAVQSRGTQPGL